MTLANSGPGGVATPGGAMAPGAAETLDSAPAPRAVTPADVDGTVWQTLHALAVEAMERAYAPYSRFQVGAAALVDDARTVSGCNVENASYGVTLCAECGLVSELVRSGGGRLVAFICVDSRQLPCAPCGRCRQLLSEHAAPGLLLAMPSGVMTIDEVLPDQFSEAAITRATGAPQAGGASWGGGAPPGWWWAPGRWRLSGWWRPSG